MIPKVDIFSNLTDEQQAAISKISLVRHYAQGETIFFQGEESNYFHFILEGIVCTYKTLENQNIEIHRLNAPSLLAELSAFQGIPFPASAEAKSDCIILKISRIPFIQLLREHAELSIALISSLTQKVASLQRSIEQLMAPDSLSKIVRVMLDKPEVFSTYKGIEIAKMVNTTPETLSRILSKLKKEKIIHYKPRQYFEILDINTLRHYL